MSEELHITKEEKTSAADTAKSETVPEASNTTGSTAPKEPEAAAESRGTAAPPIQEIPPVSDTGSTSRSGHFFNFRSKKDTFSRDKWILSHIDSDCLMDYLKLEQKRLELLQSQKETREKRLLTAFELTASLIAIIAVTWLLKDNPVILVNILYIIGIICAIWIWKNPHSK